MISEKISFEESENFIDNNAIDILPSGHAMQ